MKNSTQGFTLIELLIVVAIIGILAAVLIPNLLGARKRAFDAASLQCARAVQLAGEKIRADNLTADNYSGFNLSSVNTFDPKSCSSTDISVTGLGTTLGNVTDYSVTVTHAKGSKTYTVTPTTIN